MLQYCWLQNSVVLLGDSLLAKRQQAQSERDAQAAALEPMSTWLASWLASWLGVGVPLGALQLPMPPCLLVIRAIIECNALNLSTIVVCSRAATSEQQQLSQQKSPLAKKRQHDEPQPSSMGCSRHCQQYQHTNGAVASARGKDTAVHGYSRRSRCMLQMVWTVYFRSTHRMRHTRMLYST